MRSLDRDGDMRYVEISFAFLFDISAKLLTHINID